MLANEPGTPVNRKSVTLNGGLNKGVIDTWVRQLREQDFIDTLPLLRRTFGAFEAGERRAIGQAVRGGRRVETTVETDTRRGRAAMAVVAEILGARV